MKASVVENNGPAEESIVVNRPDPVPGPGEVRVAVEAAGLNYLDIYQRNAALTAPFDAGVEGIGRIDAVGDGVALDRIGARVGWLSGQGSFAEALVLPESTVVAIPDDIDSADALALLMQGMTAHYLTVDAAPVGADSTVLVHAGAGGVGRLLVQICHHLGATVITTASTEDKRRIAREAGADHAIPYQDFPDSVLALTGGAGADIIYDGVGRNTVTGDYIALAVRGTLVVIGAASGPPPAVEFGTLATKSATVIRPSIAHFTSRTGELARRAHDVFSWARQRVITTTIAAHYRLDDIVAAESALESRALSGKIIIEVAVCCEAGTVET